MMDAVTDLWLVRHASSEHHATERLPWPDAALSVEGQRQVQRLATRLATLEDVAALYSSPQRRARDTAGPIAAALGLPAVARADLREGDFGLAAGLTIAECWRRWPELMPQWADRDNLAFRWPGGESREDIHRRVVGAMAALAQAHRRQRIIVVAHTGTLCCYLAYLFAGNPARWSDFVLQPASVTRVAVGDGEARFLLRDDVSHLAADVGG
jgi:broad specificity phosphatase PhoE